MRLRMGSLLPQGAKSEGLADEGNISAVCETCTSLGYCPHADTVGLFSVKTSRQVAKA